MLDFRGALDVARGDDEEEVGKFFSKLKEDFPENCFFARMGAAGEKNRSPGIYAHRLEEGARALRIRFDLFGIELDAADELDPAGVHA